MIPNRLSAIPEDYKRKQGQDEVLNDETDKHLPWHWVHGSGPKLWIVSDHSMFASLRKYTQALRGLIA